ncbi:MAG: LamG domain-containing protein, partial [Verrucomicrobiales bacterium]|nr:LamG domain-containing protein [Verrucomicrobiales bacterium]
MNVSLRFLLIFAIGCPIAGEAQELLQPASVFALMPKPGDDHVAMWWEDGFPGVVEDAPWNRSIQSKNFEFVLNTQSLEIPHFGPLKNLDADVKSLAPAKLNLEIIVDGKTYRCRSGGKWTRHGGPRLVESGRVFQRADVTDLAFYSKDGEKLNTEARFETAAWANRLALILTARPGVLPIQPGEKSFGRVQGGFGVDGSNHFEIPADPKFETEHFTVEFWAFIPSDFRAGEHSPWLLCKNRNEWAPGNFGILIGNDVRPRATINFGGGRENTFAIPRATRPLQVGNWNHLALSYDGESFRLYANGRWVGETKIGKKREPVPGGMAFGRRQDNSGDGYRFRGVVDEIRFYDRALTEQELRLRFVKPEASRPALKPVEEWTFDSKGHAAMKKPGGTWKSAQAKIGIAGRDWKQDSGDSPSAVTHPDWIKAMVLLDPT